MKVLAPIGGLLMILCGIVLGLYVGVWVCFVGGIVQVVSSVTPVVIPIGIGIGILKIVGATIAGVISAFALIIPGAGIIAASIN